jgi:hypothetical protein
VADSKRADVGATVVRLFLDQGDFKSAFVNDVCFVLGLVLEALPCSILDRQREHHNDGYVLLPHHAPHVAAVQRPLASDVSLLVICFAQRDGRSVDVRVR